MFYLQIDQIHIRILNSYLSNFSVLNKCIFCFTIITTFGSTKQDACVSIQIITFTWFCGLIKCELGHQQFADNTEALKRSNGGPKSLNTKPNYKIPLRAVTPSQRPSISSIETKSTAKVAPILNQKMAQFTTDLNKKTNVIANTAKPTNQKESQINFLASNLSRDTKTKPRSRGVSPSVRSTIPAQIPGFSNDTPSNLRTNIRATSATRGSPAANPTLSVHQKPDPAPRPIRQSCSPSVTRGRKESEGNLVTQKGNILTASNGTQIFGSRMVEKVMNARKLGAEEREAKAKLQSTTNTNNNSANGSTSGFGKMMPKSSSVMALKHMV